jgi:mono/diheme cytochrome c family protein
MSDLRLSRLSPRVLRSVLVAVLAAAVQAPAALAQPQPAVPSNGRLLYETHCIACHDKQVHWRDGRLAADWATLDAQVRRWQAAELLDWSDSDITAVTRYLNDTIYRFQRTGDRLSRFRPSENGAAEALSRR